MNRIILTGNLCKTPNLSTKNEKTFTKFTLACHSGNKTDFIDCVAFDKIAELLTTYTTKGSKILIEGRLSVSDFYILKGDENTRKSISVITDKVEFLTKKENKESEDK